MTKTMLIDAANSEEIRVCVLHNSKVEDFDFESASRKPLRGNIYLARVTRVEPSLQAAFVEFGGNRHGFLAFNEIHPDYYQIPISDRKVLQDAEAEEAAIASALNLADGGDDDDRDLDEIAGEDASHAEADEPATPHETVLADTKIESEDNDELHEDVVGVAAEFDARSQVAADAPAGDSDSHHAEATHPNENLDAGNDDYIDEPSDVSDLSADDAESDLIEDDDEDDSPQKVRERTPLELELAQLTRPQLIERYKEARRKRARLLRNYKIQEVVKRRQILLVQAVKEERGNKGAALTTYLSLAGRYCVLMPNTARGGGISRKIPMAADRKRLRRVVDSLDVSNGMGLIIRTAGAKRTKAEIKRDYDYLVRLWENIRTLTLKSIAPCLIYEEASLIKRAIRDLYDKDIGNILVEGDSGYREAKDFMKMLMPSHAKNVQPFKDKTPLFLKHGVESQLDAMYKPTVRLKSGGYIVINQTEALIAIDVNSGKSTRERNIEQTALRTNLEAADEVARQCRLRDLAGLIVIDFIDMEEGRNNRAVEKRLKDALRADRARIQLGRISGFGLLELSRQRRRSGIVDGTTHLCPTCGGAGAVRSHEMAALRILRAAETEALSSKAGNIQIKAALDVTLYILNHKREWLSRIENDYGVKIELTADSSKAGDNFEIEKTGARAESAAAPVIVRADMTEVIEPDADEEIDANSDEENEGARDAQSSGDDDSNRRKRRRRRKRREQDSGPATPSSDSAELQPDAEQDEEDAAAEASSTDGEIDDRPKKRRRRGRRGGRRNNRRGDDVSLQAGDSDQPTVGHLKFEGITSEIGDDHSRDQADVEPHTEFEENLSPTPESPAEQEGSSPEADESAGKIAVAIAEPQEPETTEPVKPTRKGWWNRALGG